MKASKIISKKLNKRFSQKQNEMRRQPGVMGDGAGGLLPAGLNNFVYVTIADKVLPVFNNRVSPQIGVKVWVGYAPEEPTLFQVLSTRSETPAGVAAGFVGYAPAKRYEWNATGGGQDPLHVHLRAFSPLKLGVSSLGGMYVNLYKGTVHNGTSYLTIARQDIDLSAHLVGMAAGKACLVMITINNVGTVIQTKGSDVDLSALATTDRPAIPANTIYVCGCVRIYYGQTEIREGRANTDFDDLRYPGLFQTGGVGGVGDISGTGVIGQVAEFVTNTKTIQAAKIIGPAANIITITNAAASTLAYNVTAGKTVTITATDNSSIVFTGACNLTIPTAGSVVAALLGTANVFSVGQQMTALGIGQAPPTDGLLVMTRSITNPVLGEGVEWTEGRPVYSISASFKNFYTARINVLPIVSAGVTMTDTEVRGTWTVALRNYRGALADDSGTLASLSAHTFEYGHFNENTSATPVTTKVYGMFLRPFNYYGTITTLYDFYVTDDRLSLATRPVTHYGIYHEVAQAKHYLAGILSVGAVPNTTDMLHITGTSLFTGAIVGKVPTTTAIGLILQTTDDNTTKSIFETQSSIAGVTSKIDALGNFTSYGSLLTVKRTSADVNAPTFVGEKARTGGVLNGDGLFQLSGYGLDNTAVYRQGANIIMYANGTWTATSAPGTMSISTTPVNTIVPVIRLTITATGQFQFFSPGDTQLLRIIAGATQATQPLISTQTSGFAVQNQICNPPTSGVAALETVFNEAGAALLDFRIETDSYNALFVDASNDSIVLMSNAAGKVGFFGATAIAQPLAATDLGVVLSDLGLRAAGTAYPITTSGAVILTGGLTINTVGATITDVNIVLGTTTGTKIGTATNQKLGFFNAAPVVQRTGIVDADGSLADVTAKFNTLITALEALGLLATV